MNAFGWTVANIVLIATIASTAQATVNIETVPVGDPGNPGDTRYPSPYRPGSFGAVSYTYSIGKYEVTAGQYCEFLNKVAATDTYNLYNEEMWFSTTIGCGIQRSGASGSYTYTVASDAANRPVNYVSFWDACRFANWLHNDQPTGAQAAGTTETGAYTLNGYNNVHGATIQRNAGWKWAVTNEDEWYKAAYYNPVTSSYYDFPTCSNTAPGRDLADVGGNNANYYYAGNGSGSYSITSTWYTTQVGEFQNSPSPYGTFDQAGNVDEWNESTFAALSWRATRGGSYAYSDEFNTVHAYWRTAGTWATSEVAGRGFRLAEVPEPASLVLLALGALGLRRRKNT